MSKEKRVSVDEMSDIATLLRSASRLTQEASEEAFNFLGTSFYQEGKALEKLSVYPTAFSEISDLANHYERIAQVVDYTSQVFQETDQAIASTVQSSPSMQGKGGKIY